MSSVFVTGVSGGIGQAIAVCLSSAGWQVFGADLKPCDGDGELSGFWQGDLAQEDFWLDVIVPELSKSPLTGLVNNAAVQPCAAIADLSLEEWNRTLASNLSAAFLGTKYLAPLMKDFGGSIVNVVSVHAMATSPGMSAYVASKGGLLAFTRASAVELAQMGVRVNAVLPGAIDTKMLEEGIRRSPRKSEDALDVLAARTPLRRIGEPSEIAAAIEFLLDSDRSAFVTGQSLVVDGGVLASLASE